MDSPESEQKRVARVKELENIVRKLEKENKQLLNKVQTSASDAAGTTAATGGRKEDSWKGSLDDLETGLISLNNADDSVEDEWLYTSPAHPPTPTQKRMTPQQWLSEGHARNEEPEVPSLDDVRKTLSFTINDAEKLSKPRQGAELLSPQATRQPTNRTAQRYQGQARRRRQSPPDNPQPSEDDDVPIVRWKPQRTAMNQNEEPEEEEEIPVVSWKPRQAVNVPTDDEIPVVKWKPAVNVPTGGDEIPVVKWKPAVNVPTDDDEIPVVKWKPAVNVPTDDEIRVVKWKPAVNVPTDDDEIPVVKWKPAVNVPTDDEIPVVKWKPVVNVPTDDDEIPVVKWKPSPTVAAGEKIPKVSWKPQVPRPEEEVPRNPPEESIPKVNWRPPAVSSLSDDEETTANEEDNIPVVRWKPQMGGSPKARPPRHSPAVAKPRNIPVKAILTYEKRAEHKYASEEDQLSQESYGSSDLETAGVLNGVSDLQVSLDEGASEPVQRTSRYQAHHSGVPRPSSHSSLKHRGTSPSSSSSHLPRQVRQPSPRGSPRMRSRSPSPSLQQPIIRSRSPSPSVRHGGAQLSSSFIRNSPQDARKQILPPKASSHSPRSLSPGRSNIAIQPQRSTKLHSPGNSPVLVRKQSSGGGGVARTTPPASPGQHPSGLPHHPSSRTNLSKPATVNSSPASRINSRSDVSPSSRVQRGARSGMTPPGGLQSKSRRVLPTPPSSSGTKLSIKSPSPQSTKPRAGDDSWLEGCF